MFQVLGFSKLQVRFVLTKMRACSPLSEVYSNPSVENRSQAKRAKCSKVAPFEVVYVSVLPPPKN